ncbi:MAG TPA: HAMP domain-containing sensor histidine kinase [Mobilitalea sp.]|nr:HAMP domain-containing sensor histidine kinase [Mobilitalea sp.]
MDWLDERIEKLRTGLRNLSLRKALSAYIIICILIIALLTVITLAFCNRWDKFIWSKYAAQNSENIENFSVNYYDYSKLTDLDRVLVEVIDFIQTWSIFLYSICGIIGVSYLFYRNILIEPLNILKEATDQLSNNNLDLEIYYDCKDEMGNLCRSFDLMRRQLIANNQKMWDMMEEQKRLNAAFAHDLRTPLTVLRGYTDFLSQYVPEGKVSEEKLVATLSTMSGQLHRLERYSNTMKEIYSLEEIPIHKKTADIGQLHRKLAEVIEVIQQDTPISIQLLLEEIKSEEEIFLDEEMLMEVFENLISNAMRYAASEIEVMLTYLTDHKQLLLSVADDGKGFSAKDLTMVTKPYYSGSDNKAEHFGIGLYICKLLCEKHGGWITATNRIDQGAIVSAAFSVHGVES